MKISRECVAFSGTSHPGILRDPDSSWTSGSVEIPKLSKVWINILQIKHSHTLSQLQVNTIIYLSLKYWRKKCNSIHGFIVLYIYCVFVYFLNLPWTKVQHNIKKFWKIRVKCIKYIYQINYKLMNIKHIVCCACKCEVTLTSCLIYKIYYT